MWCIMKVQKLSNIPNTQPVGDSKESPQFRSKSNIGKIGQDISKNSKFVPKALTYLGQNDGEILNTVVTAVGTSVVAPIFIAGNPFSKEDKETKWYSAMRQPISAVIALVVQLWVNNVFNDWMAKSASTGRLGEIYDLQAMPKAKYLSKIIELEHPEYSAKEVRAEVVRRQTVAERRIVGDYRQKMKDKKIDIHELVSKDALDDAQKKITEEIKEKYKDELKGKSPKSAKEFINSKLDPKKIEERAIANIEKSIEAEAKSKFKVRELASKFPTLDDAIKHITTASPASETEKKLFDNVLERLETIKYFEETHKMKPFSSVKDLGATYDKVLHNVKVKRLVKAKVSDASKAFSKLNKWAGIFVSLVTLPFSCGALNWAYPRVMEKIMPKLQPWIHRNDPDWTPEKAKKYGPPEKVAKAVVDQKTKVEVEDEEEDDE